MPDSVRARPSPDQLYAGHGEQPTLGKREKRALGNSLCARTPITQRPAQRAEQQIGFGRLQRETSPENA